MEERKTTIREMEGGAGIVLPPEILAALGVLAGDEVVLRRTPAGCEIVSPAWSAYESVSAEFHDALRSLAR